MRLTVSTPFAVVVETEGVTRLRAEDESGCFGVLPGHEDLLTVLPPSVVTWCGQDGEERHVAVCGGVLSVRGGRHVEVATPEAVPGPDLAALERDVVEQFRRAAAEREGARAAAARLQTAVVRTLRRYVELTHGGHPAGPRHTDPSRGPGAQG